MFGVARVSNVDILNAIHKLSSTFASLEKEICKSSVDIVILVETMVDLDHQAKNVVNML